MQDSRTQSSVQATQSAQDLTQDFATTLTPSVQKSPRRLFVGREHPQKALLMLPEHDASSVNHRLASEKTPSKNPATLSVDIYQSDKEIIICAPIAGVSKESLKIQMNADVLTIEGHRELPVKPEEAQAIVQEVYWGDFSRSIILPDFIDRSQIRANTQNKVLTIRIPKTEDFKTKWIEIDEKTD